MEKSCWTCNWLRLWKLYGSATKRKALLKKASIKSHLEFSQRFVWDSNIDWKKVLWSDETKTKQYVWQKHTCIHSFIFIYFPEADVIIPLSFSLDCLQKHHRPCASFIPAASAICCDSHKQQPLTRSSQRGQSCTQDHHKFPRFQPPHVHWVKNRLS